ncbi:hypothetical protein B4U79_05864, partial [Dinothrombium tinctorium]
EGSAASFNDQCVQAHNAYRMQEGKPTLTTFDKKGSAISFNDQCVQAHNAYRKQEGKPTLTTDLRLVNHAQRRANQLSASCSFDHNGNLGSGYGENLAGGYYNCAQSVKMWYDEKRFYTAPVFSAQTGHYTQVVWRGTTKV